ncbi:MAG: MFS transporter [Ruminococcaceae bacterium]|nr:MFS transporter [Oscillospiraceae bacterium]
MESKKSGRKFNYTWVVIAMSFLMVMISLGFTSSTKSLFPDEIAKELDVERSLVAIGESCRYISTAVVNIFFGFLVAKFGPKKLICTGYISLIVSMLLYSYANNLFVIYAGGILWGVGLSFTATTMVGYIVGIWCSKNKGTIMGAVLASNGLGGAIAIQIAGGMIDPNVQGSYRAAYKMIAAVLAVTLIILIIFLRDKPKNDDIATQKSTKKASKKGGDWSGIEFTDAIKKFHFWGILICIFFSGVIIQGISGITKMHMTDVGIDYSKVLSLMSFGSIILISAKFMTGFIYDKFGLRITASWCTAIAVITTFILALIKEGSLGFTLALIYTVISPFATPLETVMLPIYAADLFGKKSYPKILGIFVSVNTAGYAVGAPLLNLCYDIFNSYVPALILVAIIMAALLVLLQFVISAAHKERKQITEQEAAQLA